MGNGINAYLPAIQHFADTVSARVSSPPSIDRPLDDGCGEMEECRLLATADRDSTESLRNFLTAAEKGVWGYISIARQSMSTYQNANEAAVWELTKRSRPDESRVPVEGMSPSALGPSPIAPVTPLQPGTGTLIDLLPH
ncbi:hypothetical protein [Amycolatopsis decaplanina]|uniref:Uncharacterized protein n=1 Tax=Amycolatopsis decaplanina DSM 44594 TaxID=1284240 RepID=M2XBM7_9PSEU|nr:hypothetical protein [Amycolatopsis decaplanina]EME58536.1 hypothetical protein H074_18193 [Amycolatopsis decaplanina DSM 44594]